MTAVYRQTPGPRDQALPRGTCFLSCSEGPQATLKTLSSVQAKEALDALVK